MTPPDLALSPIAGGDFAASGRPRAAPRPGRPARVLYAPVAGGEGSGERLRSEAIAAAVAQLAPDTEQALAGPIEPGVRGVAWLPLPDSPTRAPAELIQAIARFRPDWLVFDGNVRSAVLGEARRRGLSTVFIASRPSAVRRALPLRRRCRFDRVWLLETAPPEGMARLVMKIRESLAGPHKVRRWASLHRAPDDAAALDRLARLGIAPGAFLLSCPGGGGYRRDGMPSGAWLAQAAARAGARLGLPVLALAAASAPAGTHLLGRLEQPELLALVRLSRAALLGGGSVLVQAITEGALCVAVPWQAEQRRRIERLARRDLACAGIGDIDATAERLQRLAQDPALRAQRTRAIASSALGNGLQEAAAALAALPVRQPGIA
ncbi:MAG: hypothetical protein KF823_09390 [Xanthomonadales bacterium]|nr:hypothetical protein [Xanthomonadales bacterium]